jgi:hypothetical protein
MPGTALQLPGKLATTAITHTRLHHAVYAPSHRPNRPISRPRLHRTNSPTCFSITPPRSCMTRHGIALQDRDLSGSVDPRLLLSARCGQECSRKQAAAAAGRQQHQQLLLQSRQQQRGNVVLPMSAHQLAEASVATARCQQALHSSDKGRGAAGGNCPAHRRSHGHRLPCQITSGRTEPLQGSALAGAQDRTQPASGAGLRSTALARKPWRAAEALARIPARLCSRRCAQRSLARHARTPLRERPQPRPASMPAHGPASMLACAPAHMPAKWCSSVSERCSRMMVAMAVNR